MRAVLTQLLTHTHTHEVIEKNSLSDGPKMLVKNFERNKVIHIYIERIKNIGI